MEDLSRCAALGEIITEFHDAGHVVTAVCHGPAGLLPANRQDSSWLFQGRRMTAFTDEEKRLAGLAQRARGSSRIRCESGEACSALVYPGSRTSWWTATSSPARTQRPPRPPPTAPWAS
ncbi:MAG: DJ-1/PfpI family protein [Pseudonocardiales bacterium]|nr:DJ-1/PfpI family protein [Pseudonocardiales bacterium]